MEPFPDTVYKIILLLTVSNLNLDRRQKRSLGLNFVRSCEYEFLGFSLGGRFEINQYLREKKIRKKEKREKRKSNF